MERDDVKGQITTIMIYSDRNGNHSLFNIIIITWYRLSLVSRIQTSLSR